MKQIQHGDGDAFQKRWIQPYLRVVVVDDEYGYICDCDNDDIGTSTGDAGTGDADTSNGYDNDDNDDDNNDDDDNDETLWRNDALSGNRFNSSFNIIQFFHSTQIPPDFPKQWDDHHLIMIMMRRELRAMTMKAVNEDND